MRIGRQIAIGRCVDVGEIAPPAARDQDFLTRCIGMIGEQHAPPGLPGDRSRHHPRCAGTENDRVVGCR